MKTIKLIMKVYTKNIISSIFLFIIFTISIYFFSLALGEYRFITYTKDLYEQSNLQDAIYYMPSGFGAEISRLPLDEQYKVLNNTLNNIESFPATQEIIKSPWVYNGIKLYDNALLEAFPPELASGTQLDSNHDFSSDIPIDAIIGGESYRNVKIGDTITVPLYDENNHTITVHVVGKMSSNLYLPDFGFSSTNMNTQSLLQKQGDIIICRYTPYLASYLNQYVTPTCLPNFFIRIAPDSSEESKQQLLDFLSQNGRRATYDDIIKNTNDQIITTAKTVLPLPLFFLVISSIALISISILFVYKQMKSTSIYYLSGCSKAKGFSYIAYAIGGISILAGIITSAIIGNINGMIENGFLGLNQYRFDQISIWFIVVYIAIILLISIGIPYIIYRKASPIDLYKGVQ